MEKISQTVSDFIKTKKMTAIGIAALIAVILFFACSHFVFARSKAPVSITNGESINTKDISIIVDEPSLFKAVKFELDGNNIEELVKRENDKTFIELENLSEGEHELIIGFSDKVNPVPIESQKRIIKFTVDLTPPIIEITYPKNDLIKEKEAEITGKTEPGAKVEVYVNGAIVTTESDPEGKFSFKINCEKEVNKLSLCITDRAGNSKCIEKKIILDENPPLIKILSPKPGEIINTDYKTISVEVSDAGSGILDKYMEIDGKKVKAKYDPQKKMLYYDMSAMDEGNYEVKIVAIDKAGQESSADWIFKVDSREEPGIARTRLGAVGEDVRFIQKRLMKIGYLKKENINGKYDKTTEEAVRRIQEKKNLPVTGMMDRKTICAISNRINVYLNEFKLVLISPENKVLKKYSIACGSAYYPTPTGNYMVTEKIYCPTWYPPNSPWAKGSEPIAPGPGNPLGTRWIGLNGNCVGIHGTPSSWSIGSAASHGCIRMLIPDVEELYEYVNIGVPVTIYQSCPKDHLQYFAKQQPKQSPIKTLTNEDVRAEKKNNEKKLEEKKLYNKSGMADTPKVGENEEINGINSEQEKDNLSRQSEENQEEAQPSVNNNPEIPTQPKGIPVMRAW